MTGVCAKCFRNDSDGAFLIGLHVASSLGLLGVSLMAVFADRPLYDMLGIVAWNTNTGFILVAIPLFL